MAPAAVVSEIWAAAGCGHFAAGCGHNVQIWDAAGYIQIKEASGSNLLVSVLVAGSGMHGIPYKLLVIPIYLL